MLSDFLKNEIIMSCEYVSNNSLFLKSGCVVNIMGNHILCDCLKEVFYNLNNTTEYGYTVYQLKNADALSSTVSKQCFLYCMDLRSYDTYSLSDLEKAIDYAKTTKDASFVLLTIIPPLEKRTDLYELSEIELSKALKNTVVRDIENLLSKNTDVLNIKEIRFDNFLSEDCESNPFNLTKIAKSIKQNDCIEINSCDAFDYVSAVSLSDAVNAVFTVISKGKCGNIYNCSGETMSLFELKSFIYETLCSYGVKMNYSQSDENTKKTYRALSCGKLNSLGFSFLCDNKTRILYALSDIIQDKYDIISDKSNSIYSGKLDYIRKMELELLHVVDRICRNNKIQYFLSGGTMLGAVRHKGFIPWDDDIDIAMLRDDYERFKTACVDQLPKKYKYQSYTNKDGYHYFFDRITINETYFATKYSDRFNMQKGISMDIFVFDKTSDKKFFQKLHFNTLMKLRLLMNVRWINEPRKDKSYLLSKLLLPILRLFSMDTYSKLYDKVLRRYEKKDTSTVLPPATDHKWRGVMPKVWFEKVTDAPFDSVMSYIPTGYDSYLKQWYGGNYMELLPLSKRVGSHDFYRLDIGNELIVDNEDDTKTYNHKGELL